jgi:hypothetical protein
MNSQVAERLPPPRKPSTSTSNPQSSTRKASRSQPVRSNSSIKQSKQPLSATTTRRKESYDASSSRRGSEVIVISDSSDSNDQKKPSNGPTRDEARLSKAGGGSIDTEASASNLIKGKEEKPSNDLIEKKPERAWTPSQPFPFPIRPDSKFKNRRTTTSNTTSIGTGQWDIRPQNVSSTSEAPLCAPRFTDKSELTQSFQVQN